MELTDQAVKKMLRRQGFQYYCPECWSHGWNAYWYWPERAFRHAQFSGHTLSELWA